MLRRLRERLTYANVMATVAVFVALGSGAYAATKLPKNSVGPKQLKKNAVTGVKVKDNSLTGKDVDESTLGQVPSAGRAASAGNADALGGSPPGAFLQSSRLVDGHASNAVKSPQVVLTIPGAFRVSTFGDGENHLSPVYENLSSHPWRFIRPESSYLFVEPGDSGSQEIPDPTSSVLVFAQDTVDPGKYTFLQCALNRVELILTCQASVSPAV